MEKPGYILKNLTVYEVVYEETWMYMKKYEYIWMCIWKNLSVYEKNLTVYEKTWMYMEKIRVYMKQLCIWTNFVFELVPNRIRIGAESYSNWYRRVFELVSSCIRIGIELYSNWIRIPILETQSWRTSQWSWKIWPDLDRILEFLGSPFKFHYPWDLSDLQPPSLSFQKHKPLGSPQKSDQIPIEPWDFTDLLSRSTTLETSLTSNHLLCPSKSINPLEILKNLTRSQQNPEISRISFQDPLLLRPLQRPTTFSNLQKA